MPASSEASTPRKGLTFQTTGVAVVVRDSTQPLSHPPQTNPVGSSYERITTSVSFWSSSKTGSDTPESCRGGDGVPLAAQIW